MTDRVTESGRNRDVDRGRVVVAGMVTGTEIRRSSDRDDDRGAVGAEVLSRARIRAPSAGMVVGSRWFVSR